ncbi:hypothetical protein [Streptomyces sp. NPDC102462]|uniref:hypothetical protein n=1 Tax=Streptomyces sp. NPDC102462 TaxID=3366178 RepID=UPI0038011CD4
MSAPEPTAPPREPRTAPPREPAPLPMRDLLAACAAAAIISRPPHYPEHHNTPRGSAR